MGRAFITIDQTDITVTRAIMRDAARFLVENTGFDKSAKIIFDDESVDSPRQIKNTFDGCLNSEGIRTQYRSYVFVEYTDRTTEHGWVNSMREGRRTPPLFDDPAIGVQMNSRYIEHEAEMTMRFRSNSKAKLDQWLNALRASDAIRTHLGYFDITYDYAVPTPFLDFIHDAWKAIDAHPSETPSLKEYLADHLRGDISKRSNLNDTFSAVVAIERQKNVEGVPEDAMFWNTRSIQRGIYEVSLTYRFRYDRIVGVELTYPAVIYNSFIPREYVQAFHSPLRLRNDFDYTQSLTFIDNKLQDYEINYYYLGDGGSRMVPWDDFFPANPMANTQTVSLFPVRIDDANTKNLFNINDLTEKFLPKAVLDYVLSEKEHINRHLQSLVQFELYSVGEDEKKIFVHLDDEYNVLSAEPLDSRRRHYVRIGLLKDIPSIHPESLKRILNKPDIAIELFKLYDASLEVTDSEDEWKTRVGTEMPQGRDMTIPSLLFRTSKAITDYSFTRWVRKLRGTNEWFINLRPTMPKYVGQYNINVRRP